MCKYSRLIKKPAVITGAPCFNKMLLLVCVCLMLNKYSVNARIIIQDVPTNSIETCLSNVYAQTYESRTFILSNLTVKPNFRIFRSNQQQQVLEFINYINTVEIFTKNNFHNIHHQWKFQMFVILLENISNFETIFQLLSQTSSWDMRAKFLVGYFGNDDIGEIFKISWRYYVVNINVVTMKDSMPNIFTYFPFSSNSCQEYKDYEVISNCENLENIYIFPQKVPLDLNGCEVKIMPYVIPPYVIDYNITKDDPGRAGIEVTIIRNVAKRMNFSIRMIKNFYSQWGYRYPDGNYSMMYKDLLDSKTDMIFGFTYGNASYNKDLDASFSHLQDSSVWIFPSAIAMPQWKNLTNIFDEALWLAIFSMMLITALAWWMISRQSENKTQYHELVICIMSSLYVLLQGSVHNPHSWKLRFIFLPWLLTCVLIFTCHQCQLISILTLPLYEHQMTTLEELVDSNMEFGFYPGIAEAYKMPSPVYKQILKRFQPCPLTPECLNRTAFTRKYAVIKNRRQVVYLIPRYYTYPNGRPMLYDTNIAAFKTRERYYMRKGYPLLDRFDSILMMLTSAGFISKWDKDLAHFKIGSTGDSSLKALSIEHLQGAFMIYILGMSFAAFILICEVFRSICCRRKTKTRHRQK